ncbi:unnamed protein product, partial [marine sediment metagenome]
GPAFTGGMAGTETEQVPNVNLVRHQAARFRGLNPPYSKQITLAILCIFICTILFSGEPDLMDAITTFLMK